MPKFTIQITETLRRCVIVEAATAEEAQQAVMNQYDDEEIVLSADDFCESTIDVIED